MKNSDSDIKDTVKKLVAVLVILVSFHWAPDVYGWLSTHVLGRSVVINARRYDFILLVANVLCGFGLFVGIADLVWTLIRRRRRTVFRDRS